MTIPCLPQELIDMIIDDLARVNDTKALARCLLVARRFIYRCRKHLFAEIVIDSPESAENLEWILCDDPGLSAYMVNIHVRQDSWMEVNGVLPTVLTMLTSVRCLAFDTAYGYIMPWTDLPMDTREELFRVFQLPSLTDLIIRNIEDLPYSFGDNFGTLDHLALIDVSLADTPEGRVPP
ncbi:hypothetical protein Hypma_004524 [Hypsizygus marmoreus]|uniref:F-box domain-containing protein n=1 Tax=Hypsizygus marmoreus TaxID=39966 RepID=A0A369K054_HYPMA|nr:hypothetical protein Hypma_004524 [Hypsizygus marmoreus]